MPLKDPVLGHARARQHCSHVLRDAPERSRCRRLEAQCDACIRGGGAVVMAVAPWKADAVRSSAALLILFHAMLVIRCEQRLERPCHVWSLFESSADFSCTERF